MSVEEYMNRGCCEETMGKPSGLSQGLTVTLGRLEWLNVLACLRREVAHLENLAMDIEKGLGL